MINLLFTACALLVLVAAAAAFVASRSARDALKHCDDAEAAAAALAKENKRLKSVQDEITALHGRFDRLAGRVYAQTRKPAPPPANGADDGLDFDSDLDPSLAAELALQHARPVAPGSK